MKKSQLDLTIKKIELLNEKYALIQLTDEKPLPKMLPGQFVNIRIDNAETFLRRPISINDVDYNNNTLQLLVAIVGEGTKWLASRKKGDKINMLLPLGNGFMCPTEKPLLIGGGVGVAPLLYYGRKLKEAGVKPTFLLGARSAKDLLMLKAFENIGRVFLTTEDGTFPNVSGKPECCEKPECGEKPDVSERYEKGFVTNHSILDRESFTHISCCGPKPMMVAVAKVAREKGIPCEVSLENMMACGLGACLCCVEKTVKGNVCVCKEGPVFNINELML